MDRVAIFLAGWVLQIHEVMLAQALREAGYQVDLFLTSNESNVDLASLARDGVTVHDCDHMDRLPARAQDFRGRVERALWGRLAYPLVPGRAMSHARAALKRGGYRCVIGVEKRGLIWAGRAAAGLGIPVVYYSLELYTWKDPTTRRSIGSILTKLAEERHHRRCAATIVQDEERGGELFRDNGVPGAVPLYLPVSVPGPARRDRSDFLQRRLGLGTNQRVLLSFGLISRHRLGPEIARQAARLPPGWVLVLHGYGKPREIEDVKTIGGDRLRLSLDLVEDHSIEQLIASADAGLVLYRGQSANERLTSRSSEKLALYMKCGVPFIAFDHPGFKTLVAEWDCGRAIRNLDELPRAVSEIEGHREALRENCWRCFEQVYDFSKNVRSVLDFIASLPASG